MDDFDLFWKVYPKKLDKGSARKAWMETAYLRPHIDKLVKAIENAKESEQWKEQRGKYIPYPATWLRGERWDDVYEIEVAGMPWHATATGITEKGRQLGVIQNIGEHFQDFRHRVLKAARAA